MLEYRKKIIFFTLVAFLLLFFLFSEKDEDILKVTFFDVGQGDSALVQTPFNQDILIDGGPDSSILFKLGERMGFFNNDIELMILTHPHSDHVSGLVEVLDRYEVERVIYSGLAYDSLIYEVFLERAEDEEAEIIIPTSRQKINLGPDLLLEILYPNKDIAGQKMENANNSSIVSRLTYKESSFLFTGDAEGEVEKNISSYDVEADVLKVSHHGSKTNNLDFLQKTSAEYAIISVGKDNRYGHPNKKITGFLEEIGARTFRTDQDGDVVFLSNGQNLQRAY